MKTGDKVTMIPETFMGYDDRGKPERRPLRGTVVYIHPRKRYYTVEFETRGGPVRESFKPI